jgi:phage N-6-adenine-methyltransferase
VSLLGFKARNHPQQTALRGANPAVDDRATTAEVFEPLHERFSFTLDVAASDANAKCARYFTIDDNGLAESWAGERVWCNPPFSDCAAWVNKAWLEHEGAGCIVMLLPANRTDQPWWHEMVEPYRDRPGSGLRVEFLPGRLRFLRPGQQAIGPNERPVFGCCLLIWERA